MDARPSNSTVAEPATQPGEAGSFLSSPFLWGAAAMATFYSLIPFLPVQRELAERYFCGHPMEYLLAGLFFLGMAILVRKAAGIRAENAAFKSLKLNDSTVHDEGELTDRVAVIEEATASLPAGLQSTVLATRVNDACHHVRGRRSADGLNDHLQYLAEVAAERLHAGYALVRTVTWAVPILGFLGTVIGITLAISNLTPEQLDKSLSAVTSGLGVAFDTTALALALSVVLVFTSFLVERAEQRILSRVEDFGVRRIGPLFPGREGAANHPFVEAELQAAQKMLSRTDELIERQTQLWTETLEATRNNWLESLESQRQLFDTGLRDGMQTTLHDHADQLAHTRIDFLSAFRTAAEDMRDSMTASRNAQHEMQQSFQAHVNDLWFNVQNGLQDFQQEQELQFKTVTGDLADRVTDWQSELRDATASGREQMDELRQQREVLLKLAEQEERLGQLQHRLTENLAALRATESFEETLHSLSAAVHLLTARARPHAA